MDHVYPYHVVHDAIIVIARLVDHMIVISDVYMDCVVVVIASLWHVGCVNHRGISSLVHETVQSCHMVCDLPTRCVVQRFLC